MDLNETMRVSIENVRNIVGNSILLLRDADLLLSKEGYSPVYGNTIGCEPSKSINQSPDQAGNFFPQYMSRIYSRANGDDGSTLLYLNIQFYHFNIDKMNPCFLAGKFKLKEGITRASIGG
ncbi:hypothetical protein [Cohnella cholangitidis]|uniref:Uncharacterized protein n=1 Tax=Cohnella cholangitidis TaxID=2598458 RepID=A0A7G5C0F3_9BACL|nr:hypothetical protein [Cohnella cholangitidis]QMV42687.1 hypothetical protein FPL14_16940 [Cohnella cholangitidis]